MAARDRARGGAGVSRVGAREDVAPASFAITRARLTALFGDRRRLVIALAVSSIFSGFTEAGILALVAQVAATLVTGAKEVQVDIGPVHAHASVEALIALALGLTLVRLAFQVPISVLPARIAADVQATLRRRLFDAFSRASWEAQSRDLEGHLQEIMTSQVISATSGALQASSLLTSLFTFLVLMISALALNALAAAVVLLVAVSLFGALRPLNAIGVRHARALSQAQMEYAGGISEANRVAEETQVFGVAAAQRSRLESLIGAAQSLFFRTQLFGKLSPNLYQSLIYLMLVGGLAALYSAGRGHAVSLGAVILLLVRAGTNGQQMLGSYQALRQSLPYIERLQEAERRYAESKPAEGHLPLVAVQTIAFEHVSFSYRPERPVLDDISFEVQRGEAVGIVGPSGAGKSTLVQVLLQLRSPGEGRYLVNRTPAEDFARADWHRLVAYVPQEPRLVHASVADNIRYFRDLDDEAVERAARLARIHEDVVGWRDGYETIVGPRADAVSGGQQQRICLARALAARPEVLVLDEPTSALDPHSEKLIQESLTALKQDLTLFVVAHRMSTLDMCDRVMVVVGGELAGFDTIDLLQVDNAYYRSASKLASGASSQEPIS
jgi:ABC-type multidrug transport system fused ATPase/permease subunit